jgi:flagellin
VKITTYTSDAYQAAEARITDIDVATDVATLVREQIVQQAATALLAQANQQPAVVLSLLRG